MPFIRFWRVAGIIPKRLSLPQKTPGQKKPQTEILGRQKMSGQMRMQIRQDMLKLLEKLHRGTAVLPILQKFPSCLRMSWHG